MLNQEIANILYEIGYLLEIEEVPFRPQVYEKAAIVLENLPEEVINIYKRGGIRALEQIPGIGRSIAQKIEEYIKTKEIKYYQELKSRIPVEVDELIKIEGVGSKTIKMLYKGLGVENVRDLERAAKGHKIADLPGFGDKKEKNILQSIKFLKKGQKRFLLHQALLEAKKIEKTLSELKDVKKVEIAGSLRRKKETIGDLDLLVVTKKPQKVMDIFVKLGNIVRIWGKGETKASVRLSSGIDADLRIVPEKSYGAAMQYFTGSKNHNIVLRKVAKGKGLKLSEYGIFKKSKEKSKARKAEKIKNNWIYTGGKTEKEIYQILDIGYIEPELRENTGEIQAALKSKLPKIIDYNDIKGDLHCHSNWDGGENSIEEMAEEAIKLGYKYLGIADHTKFLRIENGLGEKELDKQRKEINRINLRLTANKLQLKVLQGCEANILKDGNLDIKDEALKKLDYVIAGVHSHFKISKNQMTERIIKAIKNPYVKIISHPFGRILKKRQEYQLDFDKILRVAKETKTALEINASPFRLDLNDIKIRTSKTAGVKMVINSDAHKKEQLKFIELGIAQARRGWAERGDIINTLPLEKFLNYLSS